MSGNLPAGDPGPRKLFEECEVKSLAANAYEGDCWPEYRCIAASMCICVFAVCAACVTISRILNLHMLHFGAVFTPIVHMCTIHCKPRDRQELLFVFPMTQVWRRRHSPRRIRAGADCLSRASRGSDIPTLLSG